MPDAFSRMEMLLGDAGADKLGKARIAVFGLGGAGSFAARRWPDVVWRAYTCG